MPSSHRRVLAKMQAPLARVVVATWRVARCDHRGRQVPRCKAATKLKASPSTLPQPTPAQWSRRPESHQRLKRQCHHYRHRRGASDAQVNQGCTVPSACAAHCQQDRGAAVVVAAAVRAAHSMPVTRPVATARHSPSGRKPVVRWRCFGWSVVLQEPHHHRCRAPKSTHGQHSPISPSSRPMCAAAAQPGQLGEVAATAVQAPRPPLAMLMPRPHAVAKLPNLRPPCGCGQARSVHRPCGSLMRRWPEGLCATQS